MAQAIGRVVGLAAIGACAAVAGYAGLVTGACPVDLGIGRRVRRLGPQAIDVAAPREVVFDVIAQPYIGRATRAMAEKIKVLDRGTDMVLAAHYTSIRDGLTATTVETVRFTRPERVDFYLVRGPVPHVTEVFELTETGTGTGTGTRLDYHGEMGSDLWAVGERWADVVAAKWEATVAASFRSIKIEAERRAAS
jgi:hypothetical protein